MAERFKITRHSMRGSKYFKVHHGKHRSMIKRKRNRDEETENCGLIVGVDNN